MPVKQFQKFANDTYQTFNGFGTSGKLSDNGAKKSPDTLVSRLSRCLFHFYAFNPPQPAFFNKCFKGNSFLGCIITVDGKFNIHLVCFTNLKKNDRIPHAITS